MESIELEQHSKDLTQKIVDISISKQLSQIVNASINDSILYDIIEQLIDKTTEDDVWRDAVRDHQNNGNVAQLCMEDLLDYQTKKFF